MMAATRDALEQLREPRRSELAFLYSTPAYRRQLEDFGLAEVGEALTQMARRAEWSDLPKHLTDEVLDRVIPQGTYQEIPDILSEWYSGLCAGLSLPVPSHDEHDKLLRRGGRTVQGHSDVGGTRVSLSHIVQAHPVRRNYPIVLRSKGIRREHHRGCASTSGPCPEAVAETQSIGTRYQAD